MKSLFFFLIVLSLPVLGEIDKKKMYKVPYVVEQNDTLASIFKRFVLPTSVITKKTPMTQRTFKENPHVKNWNALIPGERINLFIASEFMDLSKYEEYVEQLKASLAKSKRAFETENALDNHLPQGLKASIFYMASYGQFTQKYSDAEVEFHQNSPVTFGASASFYPKNTKWSFAGSAYFSYLLASSNNLDDSDVKVPLEIGSNLYSEYRFDNWKFTGYFGWDFERFSTFNLGGLQEEKILLDQNSVHYLTIGASKLIHIFKSPFFTKLSFSKSLASSVESHSDGLETTESYDGYKILLYINKKFNNRLYLHSLFKYHVMDGPSELQTLRFGVGFGYILL